MLRNLKSPNHNWIEPKSSKFNSLCNPNIANNLNIFHNFLKTHGNKFSCFFKRIYWSMITKTSCLSFFFFCMTLALLLVVYLAEFQNALSEKKFYYLSMRDHSLLLLSLLWWFLLIIMYTYSLIYFYHF